MLIRYVLTENNQFIIFLERYNYCSLEEDLTIIFILHRYLNKTFIILSILQFKQILIQKLKK